MCTYAQKASSLVMWILSSVGAGGSAWLSNAMKKLMVKFAAQNGPGDVCCISINTGIAIGIFSCLLFSPEMYLNSNMKALVPASLYCSPIDGKYFSLEPHKFSKLRE